MAKSVDIQIQYISLNQYDEWDIIHYENLKAEDTAASFLDVETYATKEAEKHTEFDIVNVGILVKERGYDQGFYSMDLGRWDHYPNGCGLTWKGWD